MGSWSNSRQRRFESAFLGPGKLSLDVLWRKNNRPGQFLGGGLQRSS